MAEKMDKVAKIRARYDEAVSWDDFTGQSKIIAESLSFCDKENQWPEDIKRKRKRKKRPCLVIDRTNPFVRQVVNQLRQNKVEIRVDPVDNGSDPETARVLQGIVRSIIRCSRGDLAIDTACESAVKSGIGYVRVASDYADDYSFNQTLKLVPISDPLKVKIDPTYIMPDGSDIEWAILEHDLTPDQIKEQFPGSDAAELSANAWSTYAENMPGWVTKDGSLIRVVEYFEKSKKPVKLYLAPNGQSVREDQIPEGMDTEGWKTRETYEPVVNITKATAAGVLEEGEFASRYIPIVPMFGDCLVYEGKRIYSGLVWSIMDIAKSYNVMHTAEIETIALVPKAPVAMPAEAVAGYESAWKTATTEDHAYLPYNATTPSGQPLPQPMPLNREAPIMAISNSKAGLGMELKNVSGMYDPTMGNRAETGQSGIAIARLQRAGEISQFQYQDNRSRMMRQLGAILIDAIPRYMDTEQVIRILGPDDKPEMVTVNGPTVDPRTSIERIYALGVGKYDVVASDGPSYQTQREQDIDLAKELMASMPQVVAPGAHLIVKMMNSPFADDLAKLIGPPEEGEQQMSPQHQQQMQQLQQALEALQQENMQLKQGAEVKMQVAQMDMQLEAQKMQANAELEVQKAKSDAQIALQKAQIDAEVQLQKARIQAETDLLIEQMKAKASLQSDIAQTALKVGAKEVQIGMDGEHTGEDNEYEYNGGVGQGAGSED